jgi:acyl dehydratase
LTVAALNAGTVAAGDVLTPLRRTVTQEQIDAYAKAAGDPNPIHTDEELAKAFGFPTTIAHGMLSLAILTECVARWAGGYDRVAGVAVRFSKPLLRGDTIICSGRVSEVDSDAGLIHLEVEAVSDRGDRVLTNGRASVRLQGGR